MNKKLKMTSTGPTGPQKPNTVTSYSQIDQSKIMKSCKNRKLREIFQNLKTIDFGICLHMNPSACYGYKIKHFQVKFPQSIFILTKL